MRKLNPSLESKLSLCGLSKTDIDNCPDLDVGFYADFEGGWTGLIKSMQPGNWYALDADEFSRHCIHATAFKHKRKIATWRHPKLSCYIVVCYALK